MIDEKHDPVGDVPNASPPTVPVPGSDDSVKPDAPRQDAEKRVAPTRQRRSRSRARWVAPVPPSPPLLLSIEEAAPRLGLTEDALRARLRRIVDRLPDQSVPILPGVAGVRLGKHWRIRFDAI